MITNQVQMNSPHRIKYDEINENFDFSLNNSNTNEGADIISLNENSLNNNQNTKINNVYKKKLLRAKMNTSNYD